jgi:hypothetical protein
MGLGAFGTGAGRDSGTWSAFGMTLIAGAGMAAADGRGGLMGLIGITF